MIGTIIWINEEKEFGFITPVSNNNDIFFQKSGIIDCQLKKGQKVNFEISKNKAINIRNNDGKN